jgi:MFS family permease
LNKGVAIPSLVVDNPTLFINSTSASTLESLFPGTFMVGNVFGPIFTPFLIYFTGYKFVFLVFSLVGIFGQLCSIFSFHYGVLCVGRFITGISTGKRKLNVLKE